ncbi:MAG: hypothetical protein AAGJ97_12770, partial [Planctomycetota bacterium]
FADHHGEGHDHAEGHDHGEEHSGEDHGGSHDGDHGEDASHGEHGEAHGDPITDGLNPASRPDLALWTLITFGVFFVVLTKLAWGPMSEGLRARESGIRGDIAKAEQARVKAEQLLAEHQSQLDKVQDTIKELMDEARRDAEVAATKIKDDANAEAERNRQRALTDIARAKDAALKDIFDASADRVADATEKVLGRGLSGDDERRLIDEALASLGSKA